MRKISDWGSRGTPAAPETAASRVPDSAAYRHANATSASSPLNGVGVELFLLFLFCVLAWMIPSAVGAKRKRERRTPGMTEGSTSTPLIDAAQEACESIASSLSAAASSPQWDNLRAESTKITDTFKEALKDKNGVVGGARDVLASQEAKAVLQSAKDVIDDVAAYVKTPEGAAELENLKDALRDLRGAPVARTSTNHTPHAVPDPAADSGVHGSDSAGGL